MKRLRKETEFKDKEGNVIKVEKEYTGAVFNASQCQFNMKNRIREEWGDSTAKEGQHSNWNMALDYIKKRNEKK